MGLSVPQAMLIIVIGRLLIAIFSTLVAWAGLEWHIGFTVQNRYSWGLRGSYIPLLQRILLNFIWNAVQCKFLDMPEKILILTSLQAGTEVGLSQSA
jgi:nucleobase:cation symporter-1, NCS1 family